jgi:hypothetical protein
MNAFPKIKEFVTKYPFSKKFFFGCKMVKISPLKKEKKKPGLDNCNIKKKL